MITRWDVLCNELGLKAVHATHDFFSSLIDAPVLFAEGAVTGAVFNPINGVEQLVNKATDAHLPPLEFTNQEKVNDSWAGKAGKFGGAIVSFVATEGSVSAVSGFSRGGVASLSATGVIQGGLLSRSDDKREGMDFVEDRLHNAAIDAATCATFGGVSKKLAPIYDGYGKPLVERIKLVATRDGISGAAGGVVHAGTSAILKEHRFPTSYELFVSAAGNAVFGMAVGAVAEPLQFWSDFKAPTISRSAEELTAARERIQRLLDLQHNPSSEFVARQTLQLERVHESLLDILERQRVKIRLTQKSIDVDPNLSKIRPRGYPESYTYENCPGFYERRSRQIVVAETSRPAPELPYIKNNRIDVSNHEVGHAFDEAFGVSASRAFREAHKADVSYLSNEWREKYFYYIQPKTEGAGASETVAELFESLHNGRNDIDALAFRSSFPRCMKLVAAEIDKVQRHKPTPYEVWPPMLWPRDGE